MIDNELAIAKHRGELLLIDVRLGAEALAREQAMTAREARTVVSSPLLVPVTVPGDGIDAARIEKLEQFGIVFRERVDGRLRVARDRTPDPRIEDSKDNRGTCGECPAAKGCVRA